MLGSGGKRCISVLSESEFSDYDSDNHSDNTSVTRMRKKISNIIPKKCVKQINSSEMNKQFQQYSRNKMASSNDDENFVPSMDNRGIRKRKCFSKNALMARENRLKKKLYVQNLEKSLDKHKNLNKKLYSCLNNQSVVIKNLNKEIKYFKSIVANSQDIGKLLKCINENTGMQVTTSLAKVSSSEKSNSLLDSWSEMSTEDLCGDLEPLNDILQFPHEDFTPLIEIEESSSELYSEHNYTVKSPEITDTSENVGICLHISNHKVSLEFCPTCSEQATSVWKED